MALIPVTLCLPAFNEQENIKRAIEDSIRVLQDVSDDWEIVVVDDGSSDDTSDIVNELIVREKRIRLIRHGLNKGYGAALITAFYAASKQWVWLSAADNQFDPAQIKQLIKYIGQNDVVVGYRKHRADPGYRRAYARMYSHFIATLFGLSVKDINCGFKLIKRSVFDKISLKSEGALIDAEFFVKCKREGFLVKEIAVEHKPREFGEQTGGDIAVIIRMFVEAFKLRFRGL